MRASEAKPWVAVAARSGYFARGVVYLLVGALALALVLGVAGGETTGPRGALATLLGAPLGRLALAAMTVGLLCYAFWRFVQAFLDVDDHGRSGKGVVVRSSLAISGLTHAALALYAARLASAEWSSGGGGSMSTATLLAQPWGRWLLAGFGLIMIGVGLAHGVKALKAGFEKYLEIDWRRHAAVHAICRFGLVARGIVFAIFGGTVVAAAWQHRAPDEDVTESVLEWVHGLAFGGVLLATVAAGMVAFGRYSFIEARFRRVDLDRSAW